MKVTKKMGRPTEDKKDYMLRTRMSDKTLEKLNKLVEIKGSNRSEIVRAGIEIQYEMINKK